MHAIFSALQTLQPQLARIEGTVLQHDVGDVEEELFGSEGSVIILHSAEKAYRIEWYAQIIDTDRGRRPLLGNVTFKLIGCDGDNILWLTWYADRDEWQTSKKIREADAVREFAQHFWRVLDRDTHVCSNDEAFEIINSMAALVAKG